MQVRIWQKSIIINYPSHLYPIGKNILQKKQSRFNIALAVALAVAFFICALFFFWYQDENHDRIISQNMKYVQSAGVHEANLVEIELEESVAMIKNIADHYAVLTKNMPDASVLEKLSILTDRNFFDRIGYVTLEGEDISLEGNAIIVDRDYFIRAANGESGYEFIPSSRVTGQSSVVFFTPIRDASGIAGVMLGFYEPSRLNNMFTSQIFDYFPNTYLLKGNGDVVSNSYHSNIEKNMFNVLSEYIYKDMDYDSIMEAVKDKSRTSVMFEFYDNADEDADHTSVGVITQFKNCDWMILSVLPCEMTAAMIESANEIGKILLIGIISVFMILIAVLLIFIYGQRKVTLQEMDAKTDELKRSIKHDHKQTFIVNTLANTYSSVYLINIANSEYERIEEKQITTLDIIPEKGDWRDAFSTYRKKFIEDAYKESTSIFLYPYEFEERIGNNESVSVEFLRTDGGWRKIFLFPAERDENDNLISVIFAVQKTDAEKEKELKTQKALQEAFDAAQFANNAKTAFLSNMSHDIRTPMNAIIGMTTIASSNLENKDKVSDCLKKITSSCKHLLGLINEILDMSKIESGKVDLNEESFSLSELIADLISMNQSLIKEKKHNLTVLTDGLTHENVIGDKTRLQQVFTNLLTNAIKYTPEGGELEITVSENPSKKTTVGWFEVEFKDNGIGMSKEYMESLFEPFARAKDSRISNIQGTGLGMPIARNIIRMMNGDITVSSELNKGSSFKVSFVLKLQSEKEVDYALFKDLSVLVVDNDRTICESSCTILNSLSMRSEYVDSGKEAIEKVVKRHECGEDYDAVIIDWEMPKMNGIETAREIRKAVGDSLFVIMTSSHDWSDIEPMSRDLNITAFIGKPMFKSTVTELFSSLYGDEDNVELINEEEFGADFGGMRILLAEDNELNMEIAIEILSSMGLEIDGVQNGKEAVDTFISSNEGHYKLILMDIQMPVMDGYEAAKAIRASAHPDAKAIPIVAMTANAFSSDIRAALNAGMNDHIAKPIDVVNVVSVLEKVLKNK